MVSKSRVSAADGDAPGVGEWPVGNRVALIDQRRIDTAKAAPMVGVLFLVERRTEWVRRDGGRSGAMGVDVYSEATGL